MADNFAATAGDGSVVGAADDIGGVKYPRVKVIIGADGSNDGDISASNPLPIRLSGADIGLVVSLNAEKAEDAASADSDAGIPAMAVRTATPANTSDTDGDYEMLQMSAGRLWTSAVVTSNALPTGAATAAKQPALGTAGTASADVITIQGIASGTVVPVSDGGGSLTVDGAISFSAPQHVIVDSGTVTTVSTVTTITNVVHVDDNSGSLTVDNAGTFAVQATIAAGAAAIAKAEDAASADADVGVPAMAVRKATPANTSGTDGDYEMLQMSAGKLWTRAQTEGGTAADAALANAPVTVGGRATNTNLAQMSADGDVVDATFTMQGALVTAHAPRELLAIQQTQLSNTTSETTIITAGASGIFNDLYGLILANTGATTTKVTIKDATAGTTRAIIEVPTLETRGFMLPAASAVPQASAANNWTATCASATTALEVTAMYVKRK